MRKEKGITLIALVVTLVLLIIVASISINTAINDNGIIKRAKEAEDKARESTEKEKSDQEKLKDLFDETILKEGEETKLIKINVKTNSFNISLGENTVVYSIVGKKGDKIVYDNIVAGSITNPGISTISCSVNIPKGTTLTISQLYSGASYNLISEPKFEKQITSEETEAEFNFEYEYNYKMIKSGVVKN